MIGVELARDLARLILPNGCVVCGQRVSSRTPDELVCGICLARLRPLGPGCARCGQPEPPVGPCRFCAGWPEELRPVRSAVWLGPEAREIVHHLKYEDLPALAGVAAAVIRRCLHPELASHLIPLPLGEKRARSRGYNQAALIANALGSAWDRPVLPGALRRARETASQTSLTPEARLANVAGAFTATAPPAGGQAILVDDILTTGATLAAAAAALSAAGWKSIAAVTFARAMPLDARAATGW